MTTNNEPDNADDVTESSEADVETDGGSTQRNGITRRGALIGGGILGTTLASKSAGAIDADPQDPETPGDAPAQTDDPAEVLNVELESDDVFIDVTGSSDLDIAYAETLSTAEFETLSDLGDDVITNPTNDDPDEVPVPTARPETLPGDRVSPFVREDRVFTTRSEQFDLKSDHIFQSAGNQQSGAEGVINIEGNPYVPYGHALSVNGVTSMVGVYSYNDGTGGFSGSRGDLLATENVSGDFQFDPDGRPIDCVNPALGFKIDSVGIGQVPNTPSVGGAGAQPDPTGTYDNMAPAVGLGTDDDLPITGDDVIQRLQQAGIGGSSNATTDEPTPPEDPSNIQSNLPGSGQFDDLFPENVIVVDQEGVINDRFVTEANGFTVISRDEVITGPPARPLDGVFGTSVLSRSGTQSFSGEDNREQDFALLFEDHVAEVVLRHSGTLQGHQIYIQDNEPAARQNDFLPVPGTIQFDPADLNGINGDPDEGNPRGNDTRVGLQEDFEDEGISAGRFVILDPRREVFPDTQVALTTEYSPDTGQFSHDSTTATLQFATAFAAEDADGDPGDLISQPEATEEFIPIDRLEDAANAVDTDIGGLEIRTATVDNSTTELSVQLKQDSINDPPQSGDDTVLFHEPNNLAFLPLKPDEQVQETLEFGAPVSIATGGVSQSSNFLGITLGALQSGTEVRDAVNSNQVLDARTLDSDDGNLTLVDEAGSTTVDNFADAGADFYLPIVVASHRSPSDLADDLPAQGDRDLQRVIPENPTGPRNAQIDDVYLDSECKIADELETQINERIDEPDVGLLNIGDPQLAYDRFDELDYDPEVTVYCGPDHPLRADEDGDQQRPDRPSTDDGDYLILSNTEVDNPAEQRVDHSSVEIMTKDRAEQRVRFALPDFDTTSTYVQETEAADALGFQATENGFSFSNTSFTSSIGAVRSALGALELGALGPAADTDNGTAGATVSNTLASRLPLNTVSAYTAASKGSVDVHMVRADPLDLTDHAVEELGTADDAHTEYLGDYELTDNDIDSQEDLLNPPGTTVTDTEQVVSDAEAGTSGATDQDGQDDLVFRDLFSDDASHANAAALASGVQLGGSNNNNDDSLANRFGQVRHNNPREVTFFHDGFDILELREPVEEVTIDQTPPGMLPRGLEADDTNVAVYFGDRFEGVSVRNEGNLEAENIDKFYLNLSNPREEAESQPGDPAEVGVPPAAPSDGVTLEQSVNVDGSHLGSDTNFRFVRYDLEQGDVVVTYFGDKRDAIGDYDPTADEPIDLGEFDQTSTLRFEIQVEDANDISDSQFDETAAFEILPRDDANDDGEFEVPTVARNFQDRMGATGDDGLFVKSHNDIGDIQGSAGISGNLLVGDLFASSNANVPVQVAYGDGNSIETDGLLEAISEYRGNKIGVQRLLDVIEAFRKS